MSKRIFLVFLVFPWIIYGQRSLKKPLTADDYALWNSVENQKISASGNLVVYELNPQKGDGQVCVYHHKTGGTTCIPRGKNPQIGPKDDFVVFRLVQPEDTIRKAKVKKLKKEEMPPDSLGILLIRKDSLVKFPRVKSFAISEENATWIAIATIPEKKDTLKQGKKGKSKDKTEDDLLLYNTRSGDTLQFRGVTEFFCPKKGGSLFFVQQKNDSLSACSAVKRLDSEKSEVEELFGSTGYIKQIKADEKGENYSFLFSEDTAAIKLYSLYLGQSGAGKPAVVAEKGTPGIPEGWSPSENGNISFTPDAGRVYFGISRIPVKEPRDSIPEDEKTVVEIWNWKDLTLQPQQKVELEKEKKRSYTAVYIVDSKKVVQLADSNMTDVGTIRKGMGDIALGSVKRPYLREQSWTGKSCGDYFLTDVRTGEKRPLISAKERVWLSPAGKYAIWYEERDSSYYARSTGPGIQETTSLTRKIPVNFFDELSDIPDDPKPYGIAGWSEEDRYVYLYDRFDIWRIDPAGGEEPVCATLGYGRKNHIQFRYLKLDPEEEFIPSGKWSMLSAFDTERMSSGFFQAGLSEPQKPVQLAMSAHLYGVPLKARNADRILWTRESVAEFPDLWYGTPDLENPRQISKANPRQRDYNWLTSELVEWVSFAGDTLKGILYKPANLDASGKYPVIVYYYEKSSGELNRYPFPSPSRSTINRAFYCSNGYLVFVPDIKYRNGFPGKSAYDAVVSGVYSLAGAKPYVDLTKAGLQGQSWGGYQTAYIITRTELFAAAMAGAPVSNMTSAYGGIRWESGMSRMFQYEHQQSRIGGTLWDKTMHYIENSPLFAAPRVNTPLLMMHNDNDGAVPWYQGIEFFVSLRRLDKPVWMLNYNGEPHNLKRESWANRLDLDKRMFGFFNHYLKGDPMPEWMEKGIPAMEKGKKTGY